MDFLFEFLNIHSNQNTISCHDCHGFKWHNINIYLFLTIYLCSLTPFLAYWIMTATNI
jgi:hypothetical protein